MRLSWLTLAALSACDHLPRQGRSITVDLVDGASAVPGTAGLYVPLPSSGKIAYIKPEGATLLDLDYGVVQSIQAGPSGRVAAFVHTTRCTTEDVPARRQAEVASDCDWRDLETEAELVLFDEAEIQARVPINTWSNRAAFSPDGKWSILWLGASSADDLEGQGVVELTSVLVADLQAQTTTPVSVGFAADQVLFTQDGSRAIVLSSDTVVVVSLTGATPERGTAFPLTLDADQRVTPVGVALTPDGNHAMITARGQDDLYVLRLDRPSVNLVNLSGFPAAMAVVPDADPADEIFDDRTVIVHSNARKVDIVEHQTFDVTSLQLDEAMDHVLVSGNRVLLYSLAGSKDVYLLDLATNKLVEYRMENPPIGAEIAPGGDFAVVWTRAEGDFAGVDLQAVYDRNPGFEVLDLRDDRGRSAPYLAEGPVVDLAFNQTDTRLDVLMLQQGVEYLYRLDLYTGVGSELDLADQPLAIGTVSDGTFWITHEATLGRVSFYDLATDEVRQIQGFGAWVLDDDAERLQPTEEQ